MSFVVQRVRGGLDSGVELAGTALVQFIEGDTLLVGRGATAQLRFDETTVALEHARLRLREGSLELEDCGSLTGTYVNGRQVERTVLAEGDWIEIGRHRLTVHLEPPDSVVLSLQQIAEERAATKPQSEAKLVAPRVDYTAAYALRRPPFLGLAPLSYLAALVAGAGLLLLAWSGRSEAFRPGRVSQAHAPIGDRCTSCHVPWRGPDDRRCAACHAGPEHQPRAAFTPGCTSCHLEHRFQPRLAVVEDAQCLRCHTQLRLAGGGASRFAARVTDFASDHPQFALDGTDGTRLALDRPTARRADRTVLTFSHALHLRSDLKGPRGPVQLDCFSCHTPDARSGEIAPVVYEQHCQGCHRLVFDARVPEAPHERPEVVHAFLLRTYAERTEPQRPLPEQRRLLPRRAASPAPPPLLRLDERVLRQVVEAEVNLYRAACARCHQVNLDAVVPEVTAPAIPTRWLPYARFPHSRHRMLGCTACHTGAAESKETAEVLLPGIAVCRNCHGAQRRAAGMVAGATTRCVSCHAYHDKSRTGEWGRTSPSGVWEVGSGFIATPPVSAGAATPPQPAAVPGH